MSVDLGDRTLTAEQRDVIDAVLTTLASVPVERQGEAVEAILREYVGSVRAAFPSLCEGEVQANALRFSQAIARQLLIADCKGSA